MTTAVIITSPKPNHQDVLVTAISPLSGSLLSKNRLQEGESITLYVHSTSHLVIEEIEKLPAA